MQIMKDKLMTFSNFGIGGLEVDGQLNGGSHGHCQEWAKVETLIMASVLVGRGRNMGARQRQPAAMNEGTVELRSMEGGRARGSIGRNSVVARISRCGVKMDFNQMEPSRQIRRPLIS